MTGFPCQPAHQLALTSEHNTPWLVEDLWADQSVGIVGGEPKSCKSILALHMVVSVASGAPCLHRFNTKQTGRVLLFAAEDAHHIVRQRLEGICLANNQRLAELDIQVITVPTIRLDLQKDRQRLKETVQQLRPKLLLLDPFIRLHLSDENAASDMAPLLGSLRELNRQYHLAVVVVHHARKGAHKLRAGQALRGSSEFHAWGDSNLYLRRRGEQLTLTIEHRAAPSLADIPLALRAQDHQLALSVSDSSRSYEPEKPPSPAEKIERVLAQASQPLVFSALKKACRIRTASLCQALAELKHHGRVLKTPHGYRLAT